MQYPVPQFTEVEDKLIGSLTVKQFVIFFAVGLFLVLIYSATKSALITIIFAIPTAIPSIGIALVPYNGRKVYNMLPSFLNFLTAPKFYIFKKTGEIDAAEVSITPAKVVKEKQTEPAPSRLKSLHYALEQKQKQEEELLTHLQESK